MSPNEPDTPHPDHNALLRRFAVFQEQAVAVLTLTECLFAEAREILDRPSGGVHRLMAEDANADDE